MTSRSYGVGDLVGLPAFKAREALAVGRALAGIAAQSHKLPVPLVEAADALRASLDPLARALGPASESLRPSVSAADRLEDNAYGALVAFLRSFARLPAEEFKESGRASAALGVLVDDKDGLAFLTYTPLVEWSEIDTRLHTLDERGLDDVVKQLGGKIFLDHLRKVHTAYGIATGATAPLTSEDAPAVRAGRHAVMLAMRDYVVQVAASVSRQKPATGERAATLLRPLTEWSSAAATATEPATEPSPAASVTPVP